MYDWCRSIPDERRFSIIRRSVSVSFVMSLMIFSTITTLIELVVNVQHGSSIQVIVSMMGSLSMEILAIVTQLMFLFQQNSLLKIFKQLKDFELSPAISIKPMSKRFFYCIHLVYFFMTLLPFSMFGYTIYTKFHMISSTEGVQREQFDPIRILFGYHAQIARWMQWLSFLLTSVFGAMADFIPAFVYLHLAELINYLSCRWRRSQKTICVRSEARKLESEIRFMSDCYDFISTAVSHVDSLFGLIIVLNCGFNFILTCILTSLTLKDPKRLLLHLPNLSFYFLRIVWPIILTSKVYTEAGRLRNAVLSSHTKLSSTLLPSERRCLKTFLMQLQDKQLAACPLNLYNITPSILLTMLSLVVTYTVILMQSN